MRNLISSLVFISSLSSLVACGGSESSSTPDTQECTYAIQYSAWSACQPNGTQTRTVLSRSESIPGCSVLILDQLSQSCTYVAPKCPEQTPERCEVSPTLTMCCPSATPYYCQSLNVCMSTLSLLCDGPVVFCTNQL